MDRVKKEAGRFLKEAGKSEYRVIGDGIALIRHGEIL